LVWTSQPSLWQAIHSASHLPQFPRWIAPPKHFGQSLCSYHLNNKSLTKPDLFIFSLIICSLISRLISIMQASVLYPRRLGKLAPIKNVGSDVDDDATVRAGGFDLCVGHNSPIMYTYKRVSVRRVTVQNHFLYILLFIMSIIESKPSHGYYYYYYYYIYT